MSEAVPERVTVARGDGSTEDWLLEFVRIATQRRYRLTLRPQTGAEYSAEATDVFEVASTEVVYETEG